MIVERTLAGTLLNDHRDTNRLRTCEKAFATGNLYRWLECRVEISVAFRCVCALAKPGSGGNEKENKFYGNRKDSIRLGADPVYRNDSNLSQFAAILAPELHAEHVRLK